jgi:DNA repair protein RecO (recombination protein O)
VAYLDDFAENDNDFHLRFVTQLSKYLGFVPDPTYREGDYFDLEEGLFVSLLPGHPYFLSEEESGLLARLMRLSLIEPAHRFSRQERKMLLSALMRLYAQHVPLFGEVKSLPVLQEVFDA